MHTSRQQQPRRQSSSTRWYRLQIACEDSPHRAYCMLIEHTVLLARILLIEHTGRAQAPHNFSPRLQLKLSQTTQSHRARNQYIPQSCVYPKACLPSRNAHILAYTHAYTHACKLAQGLCAVQILCLILCLILCCAGTLPSSARASRPWSSPRSTRANSSSTPPMSSARPSQGGWPSRRWSPSLHFRGWPCLLASLGGGHAAPATTTCDDSWRRNS